MDIFQTAHTELIEAENEVTVMYTAYDRLVTISQASGDGFTRDEIVTIEALAGEELITENMPLEAFTEFRSDCMSQLAGEGLFKTIVTKAKDLVVALLLAILKLLKLILSMIIRIFTRDDPYKKQVFNGEYGDNEAVSFEEARDAVKDRLTRKYKTRLFQKLLESKVMSKDVIEDSENTITRIKELLSYVDDSGKTAKKVEGLVEDGEYEKALDAVREDDRNQYNTLQSYRINLVSANKLLEGKVKPYKPKTITGNKETAETILERIKTLRGRKHHVSRKDIDVKDVWNRLTLSTDKTDVLKKAATDVNTKVLIESNEHKTSLINIVNDNEKKESHLPDRVDFLSNIRAMVLSNDRFIQAELSAVNRAVIAVGILARMMLTNYDILAIEKSEIYEK